MPEKPLLSFVLVSYNQAQFVREAVQSALNQSYQPLEIILSDDCSTDGTFAIIEEEAAKYRGPHRVILNRTPRNCGAIGGHLNQAFRLAHGELFVIAAGDDVSLPQRVETIYQAWIASERRATSIHSKFWIIDAEGKRTGAEEKITWPVTEQPFCDQRPTPEEYVRELKPLIQGSTHAIARQLVELYGPLPDAVQYEDIALGFRSALMGAIFYIREPLVLYRRHGNNNYAPIDARCAKSLDEIRAFHVQCAREKQKLLVAYRSFLSDIETAVRLRCVSNQRAMELRSLIKKATREIQRELNLYDARFQVRLWSALNLVLHGHSAKFLAGRVIPTGIYEAIVGRRRFGHKPKREITSRAA